MRPSQIGLGVAAVNLALLVFWHFLRENPTRTVAASAPPPIIRHEPIWQTRLRAITSGPDETQRAADLGRLAEALSVAELRAVIDELRAEAEGSPGARLRLLLLRRWAAHDPAAAAAWAAGLSDADDRIAARMSVGYGLAEKAPREAVAIAGHLPPGQEREGLLHHAVQQWAVHDPAAAVAWADRLQDRKARDGFLVIIAVEWAMEEPALAAAFAASAVTAGRPRDGAMLQIADHWAQVAPEQAAEWIGNLPASESEVRDFAIGQLAATWARQDAIKAGEWLLKLPEDSAWDAGLSAYVGAVAAIAPELAAHLLDDIQDPVLRAAARDRLRSL